MGDRVLATMFQHNHDPPTLDIGDDGLCLSIIKTKKGKMNIKVGAHTFYLKPGNNKTDKKRWCCTQNKYCRACLHIVDNKIVAIFNQHNHEKK
ncbi:hypothetical protein MSG28_008205 [Choristoneura fumiferana]|uniref:Uncharacterized protein n=1 Tax=Choristoneura fumiferana TaxID=7141 RepID=A0ACC0JAF2_CHOFU|nr:hypothetical protein MSG28_008205 [Choristoneura fumiferana]